MEVKGIGGIRLYIDIQNRITLENGVQNEEIRGIDYLPYGTHR